MRYAFLVAYDGARYFGFVRQPDQPTVESELLRAFRECGLYRELKGARYRVAARTDRGVNAIGQIVALDVLKEPSLKELNAALPEDIAVLTAVKAKPDFDPRTQVRSKHYRYVCGAPLGFDLSTARQAAKLFQGPHDFKHFCKRERGKPTTKEIEYARVRRQDNFLVFDFIAPAFLWQQVRRIVEALLEVGTGKLTMEELKLMLDGRAKHSMRPASAGGLFLVSATYPSLKLRPDTNALRRFMGHLESLDNLEYKAMASLLFHK